MPARISQLAFATVLCAYVASGSCRADESPPTQTSAAQTPAIPQLDVFPESVRLDGKDSRQQVLVSLLKDRRTADITRSVEFTISNSAIATVDATGVVTPRTSGSTQLAIRHGELTSTLRIEVTHGDIDLPLSFDQDIVPILTRPVALP